MRRSLYASGGMHLAVIAWAALSGLFTGDRAETEFEVTGVTIMTEAEFDAMFQTALQPAPAAEDAVPDLAAVAPPDAPPDLPAAEAPPPEQSEAPQPTPPAPEPRPEPPAPAPEAELQPEVPSLQRPPLPQIGDQTAAPSETPTPQEAPRIARVPAPALPPDIDTAPAPLPSPEPAPSEAPVEQTEEAAPEEATTETVTEADEPAASLAPVASLRPQPRPDPPVTLAPQPDPAPVETAAADSANVDQAPAPDPQPAAPPEEPAPDAATEAAIAAALAAAGAGETPVPPAPTAAAGPPLTAGQREGLRIAVQECWNLGSLSAEAIRTTVTVEVRMDRSGRPEINSIRMLGFEGGSQAAANQAYEAARRAVIRCGTDGYDLPDESYAHWQTIEMTFNPDEMRLR